jgi:hypothetical protein
MEKVIETFASVYLKPDSPDSINAPMYSWVRPAIAKLIVNLQNNYKDTTYETFNYFKGVLKERSTNFIERISDNTAKNTTIIQWKDKIFDLVTPPTQGGGDPFQKILQSLFIKLGSPDQTDELCKLGFLVYYFIQVVFKDDAELQTYIAAATAGTGTAPVANDNMTDEQFKTYLVASKLFLEKYAEKTPDLKCSLPTLKKISTTS